MWWWWNFFINENFDLESTWSQGVPRGPTCAAVQANGHGWA